jgi:Mce-associated membrane protein
MPAAPLRRRPLAVAAFVLVAAVLAAVLTALSARAVSQSAAETSVSDGALAAGRQIAVDFAAYDYRHIAEDFKRVADESVGTFHDKYLSSSTGLHDLIVKSKSVSTAEVASAAVVSATPNRATVVVALNRTIDNKQIAEPAHDSLAVQLSLVRRGDRWLAANLDTL